MKTTPILITIAAIGSTAFAEVDLSKLPPAASKQGVTYTADIRPLFEAGCFRCHGAEKQKGELRLDSLEAVLKGGKEGKDVIACDSAKSPLVIAVAQLDPETAMPPKRGGGRGGPGGPGDQGGPGGQDAPGAQGGPGGPDERRGPGPGGPQGGSGRMSKPLTAEQVSLIPAWIDQGAK